LPTKSGTFDVLRGGKRRFRELFHREKRQKVALGFPERQKTLAKKLEDLQARQHKKSGLHGGVETWLAHQAFQPHSR